MSDISREQKLRRAGIQASMAGKGHEAVRLLGRRLELNPESWEAHSDLANVLLQVGDDRAALARLESYLDRPGRSAPGTPFWFGLGRALKNLGRSDEAATHLRRVLEAEPNHFGALITLGNCLNSLGETDAAAALFRQAIAHQPASGNAWWSLSNLKASAFSDEEFLQLQKMAASATAPEDRACFSFALGKAFEERDQDEAAFEAYRQGNEIRRSVNPWDRQGYSRWLRGVSEACLPLELAARPCPWPELRPVFIVSLPRSGSTLTEQILAAHSAVTAAGELPWLPKLLAARARSGPGGLAAWASQAGPEDWSELRRQYYELSSYWHEGRSLFTDKLPGNFVNTPFILQAFPEALVVDVRRQAMDVCWSCYRQMLVSGSEFAYDLEDLAAYWTDHARYMDEWAAKAPDRVLTLQYEQLVADTEGQIRRLLEFVGLPFEAGCLEFHRAQRAVNTPSAAQVRQPVSAGGVGHWQRWRPFLGPLEKALAEAGHTSV